MGILDKRMDYENIMSSCAIFLGRLEGCRIVPFPQVRGRSPAVTCQGVRGT